jgi:hypothetical protein
VHLREGDKERLIGAIVEESLAGEARTEEDAPLKLPHPLVFFALFPRPEINAFIEGVKTVVPRRAMYAGLTPTNMTWTVTTLVEHLLEEHEHFLRLEASSASLGQEAPQ